MSEASRAAALQHAAAVHGNSGDPAAVLETAEAFHSFIMANGAAEPGTKPAPAAKPKVASKPATVTKPAAKTVEPAPAESDVSKEQVGEAIEAMLNANMRNDAIKLFAKYGAKSLSGVKVEDYAAILQDANDALLSA